MPVAPAVGASSVREETGPGRVEVGVFWVVFALVTLWTLDSVSLPNLPMGLAMLLGLAWLVVGAWWFALTVRTRRRGPALVAALLAPILVIGLLAFSLTELPLRWRFELGRGGFVAAVADQRTSPASAVDSGLIGTYRISHVELVDGAFLFYQSEADLLDGGFAFMTSGNPGRLDSSYEMKDWIDLGDGWYAFVASW